MNERGDETPAGAGTASDGAEAEVAPSLEEQLASERARAAEYLDNWQRARADLINYRRRNENERAELVSLANANLIGKLLPVVDDFDLALANVPPDAAGLPWVDGIMLIQRKLQRVLEAEGVTPIEALGQPFDPTLHEAVSVDDAAGQPTTVVAELRKGYRLRDRILRPTLVRVGSPRG